MKTVLIFFALVLPACRGKDRPWDVRLVPGPGVFSLLSPSLAVRDIHTVVYAGETGGSEIRLADLGGLVLSSSSFSDALGTGTSRTFSGTDNSGRFLTVVVKDYGKSFFVAEAILVNSASPATIEGFSIGIEGSPSSRIAGADQARGVLNNGYQSWSPSLISAIASIGASDEGTFENTGNDGDLVSLDTKTSWWYSAVGFPHAVLVSGALTSDRWKTKVLTFTRDGDLVWKVITGHTGVPGRPARDKKTVGPGGTVSSEKIFIGIYQDLREGLEEYARSAAAMNPSPQPPFVPVGWNSWNTFFSNINEAAILSNAVFIKDRLPSLGVNNIQIDDGWERKWGDWVTDTAKFPSGMDGMAMSLAAMGFVPGIWMAPFLVDPGAPLTANTDWFLKDDDGTLLTTEVGTKQYILDSTHPQAREWIIRQVRTLMDWGYGYLKLDFLFAGAYEGKRYRDGTTSMEAFREVMGEIFSEAGRRGVYVLACGAPILPMAGLAHGNRTGGDIALSGLPYSWAFIKNESRNTSLRYFLNALYAGDPDTALLRDVPLEEARTNLTAALLSGRILSLGDDLPSLPPEKLALIEQIRDLPVLRSLKDPAPWVFFPRPIDLADLFISPSAAQSSVLALTALPSTYDVPEVWALRTSWSRAAVGLFNWSDNEHRIGASLRDLGLWDGPYLAAEFWSSRSLGSVSERLEVLQPAHSVSLILLYPAGGEWAK